MNAPGIWLVSRRAFRMATNAGPGEKQEGSPPGLPPLFPPLSPHPVHLAAARANSTAFDEFLKGAARALGQAVDRWARLAVLVGVEVEGAFARGGRLVAPPLEPLIIRASPHRMTQQQRYLRAIARAVGLAWDEWARGCSVPGLPWISAATARNGANPESGWSAPLLLLSSSGEAALGQESLARSMTRAFADPRAPHQGPLFQGLASGISTMFLAWMTQARVTRVALRRRPRPGSSLGIAAMGPGGLLSPPSEAALLLSVTPGEVERWSVAVETLEKRAAEVERHVDEARQALAPAPEPSR